MNIPYLITMEPNQCITITFGDVCENHVGMQKLGKLSKAGYTLEDLQRIQEYFTGHGFECIIHDLRELLPEAQRAEAEPAFVLQVPIGVRAFVDSDLLGDEMAALKWDKKALMRGRIVNKKARYNLCFADESQEPDYEDGRGRVVAFKDVPLLNTVLAQIRKLLGDTAKDLYAEGNNYYDVDSCYIGYHGDAERRKVIAIRLGAAMPLYFQWYHRFKPVGERLDLQLNHGDFYMMSDKATGNDWRKSSILTLRHAAGAVKVTASKKKAEPPTTRRGVLEAMTVKQLKELLRARGLKVSGRKAELVQRVLESD